MQLSYEGHWEWANGPEKGTEFYTGENNVDGVPTPGMFNNWYCSLDTASSWPYCEVRACVRERGGGGKGGGAGGGGGGILAHVRFLSDVHAQVVAASTDITPIAARHLITFGFFGHARMGLR